MKKIISSVLILVMCLTSITLFPTSVNASAKETDKYNHVINAAFDYTNDIDDYNTYIKDSNVFFYDFDKNGVKECVINYYKEKNGFPYKVFAVYTIRKGKVVALKKHSALFVLAGGPSGSVSVVTKKGKSYLLWVSRNGNGGPSNRQYGTIKLFKVTSKKVKQVGKASGTLIYENFNLSKKVAKINGKKVSFNSFKKWQKSYKIKFAKRKSGQSPFGFDYIQKGSKLKRRF